MMYHKQEMQVNDNKSAMEAKFYANFKENLKNL